MEKKLLRSLLLTFMLMLFSGIATEVEAALRLSKKDGSWDDPNTWFGGTIPASGDIITISHTVTLTGVRTLGAGGSILVNDVAANGYLIIENTLINSGTITVLGRAKISYNIISNTGGNIINHGVMNGNEVLNALAGTITNKTSGTLTARDRLVSNGTFTNEAGAIINADDLYNSGTFENKGLISGFILSNQQGGGFTNIGILKVDILHNGADENDTNNSGGFINNEEFGKIIINEHLENYNGRFRNDGIIEVENYWDNYDRFRLNETGTLLIKGRAKNFAAGPSGLGVLKLYGIIRMGKFSVVHLDAIPVSAWNKQFTNNGIIEGNDKGGIYAKEDDTFVENNGDIDETLGKTFLCIETPANYTNNGTGDFALDCCFLLTADAGRDQTFCDAGGAVTAGGNPTASMGMRPYTYNWIPYSYITHNGANPDVSPPNELTYTVQVSDNTGCPIVTDQITVTPTNDPIADAGPDKTSCIGANVVLGGTPSATCGVGGYTYSWRKSTNLFLTEISNEANPTVSPARTTIYRLVVTSGGKTSESFVTVFVDTSINADAGANDTACGGSYTMQANSLGSGQTGLWSITSGTVTLGDTSDPNMLITDLASGNSVILKWIVFSGLTACNGSGTVKITGGSVTQAAITNPTDVVCTTTFPAPYGILDGNLTNLGETGQWVVDPSSTTTATIVNSNSPFSLLKDITSTGVLKLTWTITDGSCTTESLIKTITVNDKPVVDAGADDITCANTYTMQAAPLGVNEDGEWTQSGGIGITMGDTKKPDMIISDLVSGETVIMTWTITNTTTSCTNDGVVKISRSNTTLATVTDDDVTYCASTFPNIVALDGNAPVGLETGLWTIESSVGGSVTIDDDTNPTSNIRFAGAGKYDLTWKITDGSCSTVATKKIIVINTISGISGAPTACKSLGDDITINMDVSAFKGGAAGTWGAITKVSGDASMWVIEDINSPTSNFSITNITGFPLNFSIPWEVNESGCISVNLYQIIINENPTINAGTDDTATGTTYNMQADATGVSEDGLWDIISQNEIAIAFDDLTNPNMEISNLTATSIVKLTWTVTNTATLCSTTSPAITITGAACGGLTVATVDTPVITNCVNIFPVTPPLDGNTPVVGETGKWVVEVSSTATATIADDTNPTSNIEITTPGVLDLTWTITDGGGCSSTATKKITAVKTEYFIQGAALQCLSLGEDFNLGIAAAGFIGGAPGQWSYSKTNGNADSFIFDSPTTTNTNKFIITNITALPLEIDLKWTVLHDGCNSTYVIPFILSELPVVDAGSDVIICSDTYTMQGTLNANEIGIWTQTGGTAVTMGVDTDPNMTITNLTAGEVITMNWTVTNTVTSCENNKKIDITTQTVIAPVEGPEFNSCANLGDTRTFNLTGTPLTGGEVGMWTYNINTGTANGFSFSDNAKANSEFKIDDLFTLPIEVVVTWTISDAGVCDKEYTHKITISDFPNVPAGNNLEITCNNPIVNIGTGVPEVGMTYNWGTVGGNFVTVNNQLNVDVDQAGTYTLTVQNSSTGCFDAKTITVTENTSMPTANAGSDDTICSTSYTLQGSIPGANETGEWSQTGGTAITFGDKNSPNMVITNLTAGEVITMLWTVTNTVTGCKAEPKVDISTQMAIAPVELPQKDICSTIGANELIDLAADVPALTGSQSGVWTYTSTVGTANFNFSGGIDTAPNSQFSIANITALSIVVDLTWTVSEGSACDKTYTKKITINDTPFANPGAAKIIDCTNTDATIGTGTALAGHTYEWKNSSNVVIGTTPTITVSTADTYTLVVTITSSGCNSSNSVTVTNTGTLPIADAGSAKTIDCTNTDATIGTAALAGHTYEWENSSNAVVGTSALITVSTADTYTLVVTKTATGCVSLPSDVIVTNTAVLPIADAGSDKTIDCTNTDATIGAAAVAGHTYEWKNSSNAVVGTSALITVSTADTYTLVITKTATGCVSLPSDVIVTNAATLPIADTGGDKTIDCTNTDATIGTAALAGHTYEWKNSSNAVVGTSALITVSTADTYTLVVTKTATGCVSLPSDVTVTSTAVLPVADAGSDITLDCSSTSVTIGIATPPLASHTYKWTTTNGHFVGADDKINVEVDQAGTYTLVVTNTTTGCISISANMTVVDNTVKPTADAGTPQEINCTTSSVTIGTGTAQAGYSYEWTTTTGNITGSTTNITTTADQAGTYTLKVTNDATSCFETDNVIVTEDIALPIANAGLDIFLCNTLNATLNATLPSGSTGLWEVVSGTVNIVNAPLPNTEINSLLPNAIVVLKWTEDNGCGTDSKTITITTNTAPTTSDAGADQTLCAGITSTTLEGNNPISGTGKWTVISGSAILSDELLYNSLISGLTDGSISVLKWVITNGGCPISESEVTISVLAPKTVEKSEYQICDGENVQLLATGGISYSWSPSEGLSATDIANPIASPTNTTTYTVTINSGGTCGSIDKEVKVNVASIPVVTITEDATINIGENIDLLATGGTGYSWSPADGLDNASIANPVATPRKTTTYNVTVSNIEGCSAEASVTIEVKEDFEIFVPQMFEPNSANNNVVKVNMIGIKNVVFKIYNRSNKEIFSTTDASIGWNGKYNGTLQNMDSYVYVVVAETYAGTKITRKGSVQLVR